MNPHRSPQHTATEPRSNGLRPGWADRAAHWLNAFHLDVYHRDSASAAEIRASHLNAILRLTPTMMAANLLNVGLIVWAFSPNLPFGMLWWALASSLLALWGLYGWWRVRHRAATTASPRAMKRAARHALMLGVMWGTLPAIWFADAPASEQLLLGCVVAGLISTGAFALASIPLASLAYGAPLLLGSLVALWLSDLPSAVPIALLLMWYSAAVMSGALHWARKSTALLTSEQAAASQQRMVEVLLQDFEAHASEALWETGSDGRFVHASRRLGELLRAHPHELADSTPLALLSQRNPEAASNLAAALDKGLPFSGLQIGVPRDGTQNLDDAKQSGEGWRWLSVRAKPLFDVEGRLCGWRGVLADISAYVGAQRRLHMLAHSDSLTGLANRLTLREGLDEALRQGRRGALMTLDLDYFKAINDTFGHSTGDAVLRAVADRLRSSVRPGDLVARLGGDEFGLLAFSASSAQDATALASRLVERLTRPVEIQGRELRIGASLGVVLWHDGQTPADELIVNADLALYEAKNGGRGRYAYYEPGVGERSKRKSLLENDLRVALDTGQLELHFQPKADLRDWRIVGVEALLRWTHPTLGSIAPEEFVPIAEACGLIAAVGDWVLNEACQTMAESLPHFDVAINVSAVQLRDVDFSQRVREALRRWQLEPSRLELEITESVFLEDVEGAVGQLASLRALGVRIALDDFGTGYSSLAYLRRFPFDSLKIDRSFVNEMTQRDDAKAIVRMICQLAATLKMRTVAEGVETPAQLDQVAQCGCNEAQGYYLARPLALPELHALLRDWQSEASPRLAALP